MNETICDIMLYGGIALAVIFAVVAVILFIRLNIPKVIGDLTGHTAKKQIKEIHEKGYESVQGVGASKKEAIKPQTVSGKISVRDIKSNDDGEASRKANEKYKKAISDLQNTSTDEGYESETDVLNDNEGYESETDVLNSSESYESETDILNSNDNYESETDVLSSDENYESETDVLSSGEDYESETNVLASDEYEHETDILTSEEIDEEATDVLASNEDDEEKTNILKTEGFATLLDVVVVHTDESI